MGSTKIDDRFSLVSHWSDYMAKAWGNAMLDSERALIITIKIYES